MKYAVISDIHGNMPALSAVLDHARFHGAEKFIFAGDYCLDLPFPNEVTDCIRTISKAYIIRGNKEDYLANLIGQDQSTWLSKQFAPVYWNFRNLSETNLNFLLHLPKEMLITEENQPIIRIFHSSNQLFRSTSIDKLTSYNYKNRMIESAHTHDEYLEYVNNLLGADINLNEILNGLPESVFIFGHNHIQWYARVHNRLFINPGSCGVSLDHNNNAAYTMIEYHSGEWAINEYRVSYDIESTVESLLKSQLYEVAPVWSDITIEQIRTGIDRINEFFHIAHAVSREMNDTHEPFRNDIWQCASDRWYAELNRSSKEPT